jgi:hypothetical protein
VLLALAAEEVGVVFGDAGPLTVPAGYLKGQRGEVGALNVVVEVGGREDDAIARRLDHRGSIIAMATKMTCIPNSALRTRLGVSESRDSTCSVSWSRSSMSSGGVMPRLFVRLLFSRAERVDQSYGRRGW